MGWMLQALQKGFAEAACPLVPGGAVLAPAQFGGWGRHRGASGGAAWAPAHVLVGKAGWR